MITGEIRNEVDQLWNTFWTGGISNPLSVIEQITYLLFAKRIDELHTARESKANILGGEIENPIFSKHNQHLRWSNFKDFEPAKMFKTFQEEVFPFIKDMNGAAGSSYTKFMSDAVFMIPNAALLDKVVEKIDKIPMKDRDTKGDLYEYMLSKIASAGTNGQFRTPRHIIKMMVELAAPTPKDVIADPACGTCGFLVAAAEYIEETYPDILVKPDQKHHFHNKMFHGSDFDSSMLRIGAMNMTLHGIENPVIESRDSLSEVDSSTREAYSLILANPPFTGSLDYETTAKDLLETTKTKKTELLFLSLFLKQLEKGGRCAVIVPDGVLFGSSKAHVDIRKALVEDHKLDAVISMPSGVFKPYAGVSTAILMFTRTDSGGTGKVFFYDMEADGFSLDDKRDAIEPNDIPDIVKKYQDFKKDISKFDDKKAKAFSVSKKDLAANKYDLSLNRYKEVEYEEVSYDPPHMILDQLDALETDIQRELAELRGML